MNSVDKSSSHCLLCVRVLGNRVPKSGGVLHSGGCGSLVIAVASENTGVLRDRGWGCLRDLSQKELDGWWGEGQGNAVLVMGVGMTRAATLLLITTHLE